MAQISYYKNSSNFSEVSNILFVLLRWHLLEVPPLRGNFFLATTERQSKQNQAWNKRDYKKRAVKKLEIRMGVCHRFAIYNYVLNYCLYRIVEYKLHTIFVKINLSICSFSNLLDFNRTARCLSR